jgi:DNA-binding response OmpR family regulator
MGKRVMIVDDDPTLVRLCRLILEREGHQVLGAFSGGECLSTLRRNMVDLILLDVMLQDMDGLELLEQIRANEHWRKIPVIVVTGLSKWQAENYAQTNPVAGYLFKPFQVARLLEQVHHAVGNGHREEVRREEPRKEGLLALSKPLLQEALR